MQNGHTNETRHTLYGWQNKEGIEEGGRVLFVA